MLKKQYKNTPYTIYEDGRCWSNLRNKFLTPKMSSKYPTYNLTINGKKKQIKVHRLVAETFLPNPEDKPIVNHKDGDTHNYHLSNLEWATAKENSNHAYNIGLTKPSEKTNKREKPVYQLDLDKNIIKEFASINEAQRQTGITNISRAIYNKYVTLGKYYWNFKEN